MASRPNRYDPFAASSDDGSGSARGAMLGIVLAVLAHGVLVVGAFVAQRSAPVAEPDGDELVFVDIVEPEPVPEPEPEPVAEPEPVVEEPILVPELAVLEPEPIPEPVPEPPRPTREQPAEPPPEVAPPEQPPAEVRPIQIGLEGQSFAEGGAGPTFSRGDRAAGGRPDRTSVDPNDGRTAVENVPVAEPADAGPTTSTARPSRGRPPRDRSPALASGVRRNPSDYPREARDNDVETDCVAVFDVDADGTISGIRSVQCNAEGYGFEDIARAHVEREFRFQPAIRDGEAVSEQVRWQFQFRIDD